MKKQNQMRLGKGASALRRHSPWWLVQKQPAGMRDCVSPPWGCRLLRRGKLSFAARVGLPRLHVRTAST